MLKIYCDYALLGFDILQFRGWSPPYQIIWYHNPKTTV